MTTYSLYSLYKYAVYTNMHRLYKYAQFIQICIQDTENDHWYAMSVSLAYDESTFPDSYNPAKGKKIDSKFDM